MKKYEEFNLLAPAYSDEYKQWLKDEGIENKEDKNDRAVQWVAEALGGCTDMFGLTIPQQYRALFKVQLLLLDQYGIRKSDHIEDVQRELLVWIYTNLDKAEWKDKKRHGILPRDLNEEVFEMIDQLDPPMEEEPELPELPELKPKVVKLKGAKR